MITTHLRLNWRQFARVMQYMPQTQREKEREFAIPDAKRQSPFTTARFSGNHLILTKVDEHGRYKDEYGVKLSRCQHRQLLGSQATVAS